MSICQTFSGPQLDYEELNVSPKRDAARRQRARPFVQCIETATHVDVINSLKLCAEHARVWARSGTDIKAL